MAFRKVDGARKYFKYNECSPGQRLVENGEYLGTEEGTYGIQHLFKTDSGVTVLNSSGHLNWMLEKHVTVGQRVNVDYAGSDVLQKGPMTGKRAHKFDLEVDDTPTTNATAQAATTTATASTPDISL